MSKIYPLQYTPMDISQSRDILKLCGIIHEEEKTYSSEGTFTGWCVKTKYTTYTDSYLSLALEVVIRTEVPGYLLRFALHKYLKDNNKP